MSELFVNSENFLWMTRGKSWEFRFLSKCSSLSPVIEAVYKTIFLRDESRFGYWKGEIAIDGHKRPYVACRCYDSMMQRDEAGRRIPHDFLLLCSNEEFSLINGLAWESAILDKVRDLYSERYPRNANEVTDCMIDFRVRIDSIDKPCDSCETLDITQPSAPLQNDSGSQSSKLRLVRPFIVMVLLLCLGSIVASIVRDKTDSFFPISVEAKHKVCIGATPVTNDQYAEFIKATGHVAPHHWEKREVPKGQGRHSVRWVSPDDARAYCDWLESKNAAYVYRLPTEEEWANAANNMPPNAFAQATSVSNDLEWTSTMCGNGTNVVMGKFMSSHRSDCIIDDRTHVRSAENGYADVTFRIIREDANDVD